MIYALGSKAPRFLGSNYFVAANASLVGDITLGNNVSIWFSAVIRGDIEPIIIGDDTNVQDGAVLHVDHKIPLVIGNQVTIGHAALLHACTIADNCLIGMGAVILSGATIGKNCIIGARSLVTQNKHIPDNSLVIGSPAKVIAHITSTEIEQIALAAQHYIGQIALYKKNLALVAE